MFQCRRLALSLQLLSLCLAGLFATVTTAAAEYKISSGDILDITVFRVPELSRQVTVDITGAIAFAPIGAIEVDGQSLENISSRIRTSLQEQGILTDAQVTVGLVATRPVTVGGDVTQPGEVPYRNGLTVRRAIALAGGLGLSRVRGAEELADLRSQREVLALDLTQTLARSARLTAELAEEGSAPLTIEGPGVVSPAKRAEMIAAEERLLKANLQESVEEKAHLSRRLDIVNSQIETLTLQSTQQQNMITQQVEEIDRQRGMMKQGLTSRTRVLEEQRVLDSSHERAADTASDISRARDEQEAITYQLARFDDRRRSSLEGAIADARQTEVTTRAKLIGVTERLAQLGLSAAADAIVSVYRKTKEGETELRAEQDLVLEPGDMVAVTIDLSRLSQESSSN